MIWVQFVKNYLSDFATKNLEKLSEAYDDRVQLRDWLISVEGKGQSSMLTNSYLITAITFQFKY